MTNWANGYTLEEAIGCVGPGWEHILRKLWAKKPEGINVSTVKEKFGGLRVYYDALSDVDYNTFDEAVEEAENESELTCETCGKPGTVVGGNWYKALCEEHGKTYAG